jgi:hypothetical protein
MNYHEGQEISDNMAVWMAAEEEALNRRVNDISARLPSQEFDECGYQQCPYGCKAAV